jgi:predicted GNAT family N-acyltransferase
MIVNKWLLGPDGLAESRAIREAVFVREQGIDADAEFDELDEISAHLILYDDGQAVATARFYVQDDCAYLGRIAVLKEKRGMGFGDLLLKVMMQKIQRMEVPMLEIHAQLHAVPFYARYGFEVQGEEYILDGLPHLTMRVASENCQYPALCCKH